MDGKFFRLGKDKFHLKGLTYGPFAPNARGEMFPEPDLADLDLQLVRELGANLLRVYYSPPRWFLELALRHELKVLVDIPWSKHLCFLDSAELRQQAREAVRRAVLENCGHPALFAFSVANEIPSDIVRWSGVPRVEAFLDELVAVAKSVDPLALCTFSNFPPTEFLNPRSVDFCCFNVYLHKVATLEAYLARLQMLADAKPLVLAEFGMDSLREGEPRKCEFLSRQIECAFRGGVAGAVVFSFTDDWFRGGQQVRDWAFGVTTADRRRKESFHAVRKAFGAAPYFPLPRQPKVSVVVASYNGARTLRGCLAALCRLNYPDYEVILVDDGSTDRTPEIARDFPQVRTLRQANLGLSVARNAGIAAATGEIVAFTDSDCRADEDWLYYLAGDLLRSEFVGIGGHNFLPPEDSAVAAAVMASPGGPTHVMLTDREAEHLPGCNMAYYKWALAKIGGFDPVYHAAGDDVDVCWRLQQQGQRLGFSPAGFVWHFRRATVRAYLKQQAGYGEAEAFLARKHPEFFNGIGRSLWRGRIYSASKSGVILGRSVIYRGTFGSGFFQQLYAPAPSHALMITTALEYHVLVNGPLVVLSLAGAGLWPLAGTSLLASLGVCGVAAAQAELPANRRRFWSRPLVALLFFLQPIERGLARYRSQLRLRPVSSAFAREAKAARVRLVHRPREVLCYWSDGGVDRLTFLQALLHRFERERWQVRPDLGWAEHDLEIVEGLSSRLRLTTVAEQLDQGQLNLRCRLDTSWSLPATILFWALLGPEVVAASLLAPHQPWIWMILLSLPILNIRLEHEQSQQRKAVAALVDEVAQELKLKRLSVGER